MFKPLVWKEHWSGVNDDIPAYVAETPVQILYFSFPSYEKHSDIPYDLLKEKMNKHEKDYHERILKCFTDEFSKKLKFKGDCYEKF